MSFSARLTSANDRLAVLAAIAFNAAMTIPLARALNIWMDEAYTVHTTAGPLAHVIGQALNFELQPPLYFAVLSVWRRIDPSFFFSRMFSTACVWAALWTVACLWRRVAPRLSAAWVLCAVALNPFTISAAVEMRVYALAILLSALMLLFFIDGYVRQEHPRRSNALYILVCVLAVYTQYYLSFLMVAGACVLLWRRQYRTLRTYLQHVLVVAILCVPLAIALTRQLHAVQMNGTPNALLETNVRLTAAALVYFVFPGVGVPHPFSVPIIVAGIGLLVLAVLHKDAGADLKVGSILFVAVVVALLCCAASTIADQSILPRYLVGAFIPLLVGVYGLLAGTGEKRVQVVLTCWLVFTLVLSGFSLANAYSPLAKPGDWQRVADFITAHERPNQPVIVFYNYAALPLSYYYRGKNVLVPLPEPPNFDVDNRGASALRDEKQIVTAIGSVRGSHPVIWLVTNDYCGTATLDLNCSLLERFVKKHYLVRESRDFYRSKVRLLSAKDG